MISIGANDELMKKKVLLHKCLKDMPQMQSRAYVVVNEANASCPQFEIKCKGPQNTKSWLILVVSNYLKL